MTAATFDRALVVADMPDDDALTMARHGMTANEIAARVAALSGLTYLRGDDATEWLLNQLGACHQCGERPATTTDHRDRGTCQTCSSAFAALGYEDGDDQ